MQNHDNLSTREAAEFLRKTERTLIRWRNARIGPAWVKAGGSIIYRKRDLDAYLDAHTVQPVADCAVAA